MTVLISHFHFGVWGLFMSARGQGNWFYDVVVIITFLEKSWCVLQLWFVLHHVKAILSKLLLCHTQGRGCVSQVRPSISLPSLNIAPENRPKPVMKGSLPNHHERCYVSCIFKGTVILALGYLGGGFKHFVSFTPTWGDDPIWLIFFRWVENHQVDMLE